VPSPFVTAVFNESINAVDWGSLQIFDDEDGAEVEVSTGTAVASPMSGVGANATAVCVALVVRVLKIMGVGVGGAAVGDAQAVIMVAATRPIRILERFWMFITLSSSIISHYIA
jgi:hypothetical protein